MAKNSQSQKSLPSNQIYPPVVSVLGHVDHGKTTLLDSLRKSDIAKKEKGGITQRIGASEIEAVHDGKKRKLTLIDTPGHEAFSNMRGYGVGAADIALLVVAMDDGVMPQTKESISLIKQAKIPFIVVFTKKDVTSANFEKAKQSVMRENILLEGLGGDVPFVSVSALKGEGIADLLDLIFLVYDVVDIKKDEKSDFLGVVIESKLDKKRGALSTIVVKSGILLTSDKLFQKDSVGKVRALVKSDGSQVKRVIPGEACEVLGITQVLHTGSLVSSKPISDEKKTETLETSQRSISLAPPTSLAEFFSENISDKKLKIVLKTDTRAELEAIKNSIPPDVKVVFEAEGEIGVSDILLAKDFGAIVIGFNVSVAREAKNIAEAEKVLVRTYEIIYRLLEELVDASAGAFEPPERILGTCEIKAFFDTSSGKVMGVKVIEGRLAMSDQVKIVRGEKEIGRGRVKILRRGKQDVKEVAKNLECGVLIEPSVDFSIGDMLLSYNK